MKRNLITIALSLILMLTPAAMTGTALAACGSASSAKNQVLIGVGETGGNCKTTGVTSVIAAAVEILSFIVGIAAVITIILAGFKYITSGGDSNRISGAKQTLVYAIVGLIVAAIAQVLVHFVLFNIHKAVD